MPNLVELLWAENRRESLITAGAALVEAEASRRGGLKGLGLKTALSMLKTLKPDFLPRALRALLPQFAEALDPLYQRWRGESGADFSRFLLAHSGEAVCALLAVTDARVRASPNRQIGKLYERLRGGAETELRAALPALAQLIQRQLELR